MELSDIVEHYRERFLARYGKALSADQWSAFNAITGAEPASTANCCCPVRHARGTIDCLAPAAIVPVTSVSNIRLSNG